MKRLFTFLMFVLAACSSTDAPAAPVEVTLLETGEAFGNAYALVTLSERDGEVWAVAEFELPAEMALLTYSNYLDYKSNFQLSSSSAAEKRSIPSKQGPTYSHLVEVGPLLAGEARYCFTLGVPYEAPSSAGVVELEGCTR